MLELLYIARFEYLAHPSQSDANLVPDDDAVALAMAEADQSSMEHGDLRGN